MKVIHFLGSIKPWFCSFNASTGQLNHYSGNEHANDFIKQWWTTYLSLVHPKIESVSILKIKIINLLMIKPFSAQPGWLNEQHVSSKFSR